MFNLIFILVTIDRLFPCASRFFNNNEPLSTMVVWTIGTGDCNAPCCPKYAIFIPKRQAETGLKGSPHSIRESQIAFQDRKSTRLNSSHVAISYAVFCLKQKTS